ncbi:MULTISPECIES: hypothetical protein [Serratia]|uniref:hypothetical protein n=1 Tax=Serratia TaxID=613 RepID=UPI000AA1AEA7|nr:hypothetical protein [Serratia sp. 506_PEND]
MKLILIFAAILVVIIVAIAVGDGSSMSPEAKEKSQARDAIKLCWEEHDRKSLDEGAKRFIAGTCEKMEAKFKNKYGVKP